MRLLYTITSYPPVIGGAQSHFHELAKRLAARHQIQVVSHWDSYRTDWLLGTTLHAPRDPLDYRIDQIPVHRLGFPLSHRARLLPQVLVYYAVLGWSIDRLSEYLLGRLLELGGDAELVHNGRVGREPLSFASLKLARRLGVPFVFTPFHHPRWVGWRYRPYLSLYRSADALICLTEAERRTMEELGVEKRKLHVLGMGPELAPAGNAAAFREKHEIPPRHRIVLFLGQKYPYKGCAELLGSAPPVWERHPDTVFLFLGPRTRWSRRLFESHRDPRILELGPVDLQTKTDALAAADVLCLPSTQESFGAVFLEAWSFSKPVIGCPIPAVAELIRDRANGLLAQPDPADLARALLEILEDGELARRLGEAGKRLVDNRFQWGQLASRLNELYLDLNPGAR